MLFSFLLAALILTGTSCDKQTTQPETPLVKLTESQARLFQMSFVDYDLLEVSNSPGLELPSMNIKVIAVVTLSGETFSPLASAVPSYSGSEGSYQVLFSFRASVDSSAVSVPLTLRYTYTDDTFSDIDTTVDPVRYPYTSAETFLSDSFHTFSVDMRFQDFDFKGTMLYYHPMAAEGLFRYDPSGGAAPTRLVLYGSGDHVAVDSGFVFHDIGAPASGSYLYRYDIAGATDSMLAFFANGQKRIYGLASDGGLLYVIYQYASQPLIVGRFTTDGQLVDSTVYQRFGFHLAVSNGILYSTDWNTRMITRFDWATKSFLADRRSPCKELEGIRIDNGKFYFADFNRKTIGVMPLADIQ